MGIHFTLWLFNVAMGMAHRNRWSGLPIKKMWFFMAMLKNQMVYHVIYVIFRYYETLLITENSFGLACLFNDVIWLVDDDQERYR